MKIKSIYQDMERAADAAGEENTKIFFRHSIRGHISDPTNAEQVLLLPEGKALAQWFGRNIQAEIGFVASSHNDRCLQTLNCIFEGYGSQLPITVARTPLAEPQVKEGELCAQTFRGYEYDATKMFYDLQRGKKLPGMNSIERSAKIMLDYIFSTGGKKNTLDLYCSHDFMLVLLICAMFGYPEKAAALDYDVWPRMLEGMVFCGTRKKFKVFWRNETKIFENYLLEEIAE